MEDRPRVTARPTTGDLVQVRAPRGTRGHVGRVLQAQHRHGVYRVKMLASGTNRRVQRANVEGGWPKGAKDRSPAAMRPMEA